MSSEIITSPNRPRNPAISIIMSVYNGESLLGRSIESILSQSFSDFEFIIINDGSTDSSLEVMLKYGKSDDRLVVIDQTNIGLTKSLNRGIRFSRGNYIARMDVDDISYKQRLEKQYEFLERNKDFVLVGGQRVIRDEINNAYYRDTLPITPAEIRKVAVARNPFFHSLVMFRKDVLISVGTYNEKYRYVQDYELWSRIIHKYNSANLSEVLGEKLINGQTISFRNDIKFRRNYCSLMARFQIIKRGGYPALYYKYLFRPFVRLLSSI